jgi:hypothetical protein
MRPHWASHRSAPPPDDCAVLESEAFVAHGFRRICEQACALRQAAPFWRAASPSARSSSA